ncbi:MAG: peptidase S41 [Flavobacteriaceae bacterium]|nr:peptidase S41 [Flavobacteriaceae bacterium]
MKKRSILALLFLATLFTSCFEDNDDNLQMATVLEIQDFIYRGLNYYYLYKGETPELANDAFANQEDLNGFLDNFESPETLFDYLLAPQDRFSILVDDYISLENSLSGVSENNGMEYGLVLYPDGSGRVFGYVRYVLPNSDASAAGLERGVIFNTVDGVQLTENNLSQLLSPTSYTIGLATFNGQDIQPTGQSVPLIKEQYTENPVYIAKTLNVSGRKIGYLMYNAFTRSFDPQLNAAFAQFKADGVTDVILDLRYNGGGSVETAKDLSSMVTGQFTDQLFYSEIWNDDRQENFAEDAFFDNRISTGEAINSLNLTQVYIITTQRTASASELVLNGLDPYIGVTQVGTTTTGKFQASFILYDAPAPGFARDLANPTHTYAMLPLVFKTANANGVTDFINGLPPDVVISEDYSNLGTLGDTEEPLLAATLNQIVPTPSPAPLWKPSIPLEEISCSNALDPLDGIMIAEQ